MSRAPERRSYPGGAAIALLLVVAACGGVGPQPADAQRVNGGDGLSSPSADLPVVAARPLPVLPRGALTLEPCADGSASAQCSPGGDGDHRNAHATDAAGELLAKGAPAVEAPEPAVAKEKSSRLPSGFYNPMPGGVFAGYKADTGLDIAGSPRPVYAIQSGTLDYSEPGHTLWTGPKDTANCVRFRLDIPIPWKGGRLITHVYYAHLSKLEYNQAEGARKRQRIEAGERLGMSGTANHSPHLHIGLLLDGEVEQYWGTFLLEDDVRQVLGGYRNGTRLPREEAAPVAAPASAPAVSH